MVPPSDTPDTSPPATVPRALHRLAKAWGVQTAYYDCHGQRHHASVDTLLAVLTSLGAPLSGLADVDDALHAHTAHRWSRGVEPVLVAWDGRPPLLEMRVPASLARGRMTGDLTLESGLHRTMVWDLSEATPVQAVEVDGTARLELHVDLGSLAPLPPGYHSLRLSVDGRTVPCDGLDGAVTVISTPTQVDGGPRGTSRKGRGLITRDWGVFLPLFALRSKRSLGIGDLTDLGELAAWVAERGGRAVATLPLLASFLDGDDGDGGLFEASPYVPCSRLAWNDLYLDLSAEPEWKAPGVATHTGAASFITERDALRGTDFHDYARLARLRRPVLDAMAAAAWDSPRRAEIEAWAEGQTQLADYARFRGACARLKGYWGAWPEPAATGRLTDVDIDPKVARRHLYAQFVAAGQIADRAADCRERNVRLLFDQPLGVHPDGYDVWRHQQLFAPGISTGAPPDAFFVKGQDWGFRPQLPAAARADGYRYVAATLRHLLVPGQMLRMDHVLGLHRLYWVPHGAPATAGAYVRGHHQESFAVLTLEASRAGAHVVGEDLGTVPRGLRSQMSRHRLLRTHVMQFAPRARVPSTSVASLNTQDMPPFAGFLDADDIDGFADLGLIDPGQRQALREDRARLVADLRTWLEEQQQLLPGADDHALMRACNARLAESRAGLALVNLEDLWDEARSHNVPGTSHERPNWKRLAALSLEEIKAHPEVAACLDEVAERRLRSARPALRPPSDPRSAQLGPLDVDLFTRGLHAHVHDVLGSRREVAEDISGVRFTVWAPGADAVSVIGDFNNWDFTRHHMLRATSGGLWEAFAPGVPRGALYKYRVVDAHGSHDHADPFAMRGEGRGEQASMVWSRDHDWGDDDWLADRATGSLNAFFAREDPDAWVDIDVAPAGGWSSARAELVTRARACGAGGVRFSTAAWGPLISAPASSGSVPQELMALVDGLHRDGLAVAFGWRLDPRAFDLAADAHADGNPWSRPERVSQCLGAAMLRVSVFHGDALVLPDDADIPADFRRLLADQLAARRPGTRCL